MLQPGQARRRTIQWQTAARLYLSEATVKGYVSQIVDSWTSIARTQAGRLAHDVGLTSRWPFSRSLVSRGLLAILLAID
jgi:hypothetical protein